MNIFTRLRDGLARTRSQITALVGGEDVFNDVLYEQVEDALVAADLGIDLSREIIARLESRISARRITGVAQAYTILKEILVEYLQEIREPTVITEKPRVILMVGVNGVGKTTTIGKMAREYQANGNKVMFGAVDTFRAGAIEQLKIWAERTGSAFIAQHEGADPASVAFDALEAAKARAIDVLFLDTAGRLHNKVNLMHELEKIVRVLKRSVPHAPDEVLLVVDATTGQNALKQAEVFNGILGITGLIITKLDGTAKGGIAVALTKKYGIPIRKIGVGEGADDLQDFDPVSYVEAMLGDIGSTQPGT
jgi:fused signal recognition particle receptor